MTELIMSTARKILSNTGWQVIGKGITALLSIIIIKLITNYLGTSGYGEYVTIFEFLAFFGIAADLGLFTIAVREMAKDDKKIPYIIGNVLSVRTILAMCTMTLGVVAAYFIPKYSGTHIPLGITIAAVATFLSILNGTISSVLQVFLKMQYATVGLVLGRIVTLGYMFYTVFVLFPKETERVAQVGDSVAAGGAAMDGLAGAKGALAIGGAAIANSAALNGGFYHLILAGVFGAAVMLGVTFLYTRKLAKIKYRFDVSFWKEVLWKSLPYGIALILSMLYFRIDSILLSLIKGPEEVGIYGVSMKILEILVIVPIYFMNSVMPVLTRAMKDQKEKVRKILQYSFDFLVICGMPLVVGGYILAYPIVFVISSPDFMSRVSEGFFGSDIGLQILVFALFFSYVNCMFGFTLVALNRQMTLLKINAGCVVFNIVSNLLVIPEWGFRGAAVTSILSEFFILFFGWLAVRKYLPEMKISLTRARKALVSALLMGIVIYWLKDYTYQWVQNVNILFLIPLGGVVYFTTLWFTRGITKEMLGMLKK